MKKLHTKSKNNDSPKQQKLSELFLTLATETQKTLSLANIIEKLGNRAFAPLLVFFAAINLIPILPPGSTAILGLPLLILSVQMLLGTPSIWLPETLLKRSIKIETFRMTIQWIVPRLQKIEQYTRPRYWPFHENKGDKIIGLIVLLMSISIVLPIPGGNWLPAFSIVVIGISLLERDFLLLSIGGFLSLLSLAIISTILGSISFFLHYFLDWIRF